jgi:protein-L-isoaspartate O-methyltransferase
MKQLNIGGVLFAPVELNQINQFIYVFEKKSENHIEKTQLMQVVSFISLT